MEETKAVKKFIVWFIAILLVVAAVVAMCNRATKAVETGIVRYEEFYEINQTCAKLNADLCNMDKLPEQDKMFSQFSKAERMNALRAQLNRWVEEYNAKSKMITRSLWKSSELPYQLSVTQFNCY